MKKLNLKYLLASLVIVIFLFVGSGCPLLPIVTTPPPPPPPPPPTP
jgi:hypothetical protein